VRFVGAVDARALPGYYRMADLFVLPSTGEGFGIAFLEAMACGTPALGLAVAGACDALGDGELGIATSEAELVQALAQALVAPRAQPQIIAAAVRRRFGAEVFARNVANLVRRLAAQPAAALGARP
jgi:phosphatidylinositol alpha-1,6-mannosyltransferase